MINNKISSFFSETHSKLEIFLIFLLPLAYVLGNAAINILFLVYLIYFFTKKNKNFFNKIKFDYFLIIMVLLVYLIFNSVLNYEYVDHKKVLSFIKLLILPIILYFLFTNKNILFFFFFSSLFLSILLSLDIFFQYFNNGYDIFGNSPGKDFCDFEKKNTINPCSRLSGFFGDELIAGTYLFFFGTTSSIYFYLKTKKNINLLFSIIIFLALILTGDRSPIIFQIIFFSFLFIFYKGNKKKIALIILTTLSLGIIIFKNNSYLDNRINYFSERIDNHSNLYEAFKSTPWGAHYILSVRIGNDRPLIGYGIGSFKKICKEPKYEDKTLAKGYNNCSNHPHNIYLEIYSELGILGLIIFLVIIFFIIKKFISKKFTIDLDKLIVFITIICFIFPFKPSGSVYSTFYGSILWIYISFFYFKKT